MSDDKELLMRLAQAICKSRTCEGFSCCQWPGNRGRTECPVSRGGYDDAAKAAFDAMPSHWMPVAERNETANKTLEAAAKRLDAMGGNELYKRAYRKAAKVIRAMKDFNGRREILNDERSQISSVSPIPSR